MIATRPHRLGVRGSAMLLCAFIWSLIGAGAWFGIPPYRPGTLHAPNWLSCSVWLLSAGVAVVTAYSRRKSPIGLAALVALPTFRTASYVWSWATYLWGGQGYEFGWLSAAFYVALVWLVYIAAMIPSQVGTPLTGPSLDEPPKEDA